ncbi:MAG: peptidoglycan editing factor PgeF [Planktomarina sp.]
MTLTTITSDMLADVRHGFFTRLGGASSGIYHGLNCGKGSDDQAEVVDINRARVADAMSVATNDLRSVHQCHSADVVVVTAEQGDPIKADAMVTSVPDLALGILTADCQPVLFSDPVAGVIAAAHAGWKGAKAGILQNTVDAMMGLGATVGNIKAVIGPCISQSAYEVGPEFFETVCDDDPDATRFFAQGVDDRMMFDLPGYGLYQLCLAGVTSCEWTRHCTYGDAMRFFSYRRSVHQKEADYGRLISCICL